MPPPDYYRCEVEGCNITAGPDSCNLSDCEHIFRLCIKRQRCAGARTVQCYQCRCFDVAVALASDGDGITTASKDGCGEGFCSTTCGFCGGKLIFDLLTRDLARWLP